MKARAILGACLLGAAASSPAFADPADELQALRAELRELRRQDEERERLLRVLEQRVRQLEATVAPAPAQPLPVAVPYIPPRPAAGAFRSVQAQAPAQPEADDDIRRAPPQSRAVETLIEEEQGLFSEGATTFELGVTYSHSDQARLDLSGFLALDAIFLGTINVDEVQSDIVTVDLGMRYGLTERIELDVDVPLLYRSTAFRSGGAGGAASSQIEEEVDGADIGDVSAGASFRLFKETESFPDLVVSGRVKAPTGLSPFGIETRTVPGSQGNLSVPEDLPTGSGVWAVSGGVSALKTIDPLVVFGSVTYFHNFKEDFDDIDSAAGDQPGEVDAGNAVQVGAGVAFALNERSSLSFSYAHRFVFETELKREGQPSMEVVGSDANVGILSLGGTFVIDDNLSLIANVGAGLTPDAPDVTVSFRLPYRF